MRKNEKKSIFSLGPNGPILQIFLVVQYLVGSLKIPSDGSKNLISLDQVKKSCDICFRNKCLRNKFIVFNNHFCGCLTKLCLRAYFLVDDYYSRSIAPFDMWFVKWTLSIMALPVSAMPIWGGGFIGTHHISKRGSLTK